MANRDTPMGLIPAYMEDGSPLPAVQLVEHTTGTAVFKYDFLKPSGGNYISVTGVADNPTHIALEYVASTVATGTRFQAIPLVPGLVCKTQVDDASIADSSQEGAYFDIVLTHAGSTTTGISGIEMDGNGSAEDTLILVGLVNEPENAYGANVKVYVKVRVNADAQVIATT